MSRHTSLTNRLSKGVFNESQAKVYYGLSMDSKMIANYGHLITKDANDCIREAKGLAPSGKTEKPLKALQCQVCHTINKPDANYCTLCGKPLTTKARMDYRNLKRESLDLLQQLMQDPQIYSLLKEKVKQIENE